jgi:DNA-directed RNA polymerase subunit RPC12/RpoP
MEEITVPCKKCSKKVPVSELKLDYDEEMVICTECVKNKITKKEIHKEFHKKKESAPKPILANPNKIIHQCVSCNFKFKIDMGRNKPNTCPYCDERILNY